MEERVLSLLTGWIGMMMLGFSQAQPGYLGCMEETHPRIFGASPGGYDPNNLTPDDCRVACSTWNFIYAGLSWGKLCFCSDTLPAMVLDTNCSMPCTGDGSVMCGGLRHTSIYSTPLPIDCILLESYDTSWAKESLFARGEEIIFSVAVTTAGSGFLARMDFNDGGGWSDPMVAGNMTKAYDQCGEYHPRVAVTDAFELLPPVEMSVWIRIECPPEAPVDLVCPEAWATNEELQCSSTITRGSGLVTTNTFGNGASETFFMSDAESHGAGRGIPYTASGLVDNDAASTTYILRSALFQEEGYLQSFEYYAVTTGAFDVSLLRPTCAPYCLVDNTCSSCTPNTYTCVPGTSVFCPSAKTCALLSSINSDPSCTASTGLFSNPPPDYTMVNTWTVTAGTFGRGIHDVAAQSQQVYPGDILAYTNTGGASIGSPAVLTGAISDVQTAGALGASISAVNGLTPTNSQHLLRATATGTSVALSYPTYPTAGTYTFTTQISSNRITAPPVSNSTSIIIQDRIGPLVFASPVYVATGSNTISLHPLVGTDPTFTWFVDGVEIQNTTTINFIHTLLNVGPHNITVRGLNLVSEAWNSIEIIVEETLSGLAVSTSVSISGQPASLNLTLASGSHYVCTWDYGDSSSGGTSNDTTTPVSGSDWAYTWSSAGDYTVSVTCTNDISSVSYSTMQTVQDTITGLQLLTTGAVRGVAIMVDFDIATGTSVSYIFHLDGTNYPAQVKGPLQGGTVSTVTINQSGLYSYNLTASNLVSSETISGSFTVDVPITNPVVRFSPFVDYPDGTQQTEISSSATVNFNITMDAGSGVELIVDYGDGTNDTWTSGALVDWPLVPGFVNFAKFYSTPGAYKTSVTISNPSNSYVYNHTVYYIQRVGNLTMMSCGSVGFHGIPVGCPFGFLTPNPPSLAKVQVLSCGNGQDVSAFPQWDFGLWPTDNFGPCEYGEVGTFIIKAEVSNTLGSRQFETVLTVVLPIIGMKMNVIPNHVVVNTEACIDVSMEYGLGVRLVADWGDGTVDSQLRQGNTSWDKDTFCHTYTTVSNNDITVTGTNAVGSTSLNHRIAVQNPVTADFSVTSNAPRLWQQGTDSSKSVELTLTYPTTSVLPTDAEYQVICGNGVYTLFQPLPFTAPGPHSLQHTCTYSSPGDYMAEIRVKNLASSQNFSIPTGVFETISGLGVTIKYRYSASELRNGAGENNNIFPTMYPIEFDFSFTSGTPALITVTAVAREGSAVHSCNTTTSTADITFTEEGTYDVSVLAWTPLDSLVENRVLVIANDVTSPTVPCLSSRFEPNKETTCVLDFGTITQDACVILDQGNGLREGYGDCLAYGQDVNIISATISDPLTVSFMYSDSGTYDFTISSYTQFGIESSTTRVVVSGESCEAPSITIQEGSQTISTAPQFTRADDHSIVAYVELSCDVTVTNDKQWQLQPVNEFGEVQSEKGVDISKLESSTTSVLRIPKRFLPYGFYKATLTVQMTDGSSTIPFLFSTYTYLQIIPSPLIIRLTESVVDQLTVAYGDTLTLQPDLYSYDSDLEKPPKTDKDIKYEWWCRQEFEELATKPDGSYSLVPNSTPKTDKSQVYPDNGGCFRDGPGAIINTQGEIHNSGYMSFDTSLNLQPDETYVMIIQATKGDRVGSAVLRIKAMNTSGQEIPFVTIGCKADSGCVKTAEGIRISSSDTMRLVGGVDSMSKLNPQDVLTYSWEIKRQGLAGTGSFLSIINVEGYYLTVTHGQAKEIAVSSDLFKDGFELYSDLTQYLVTLSVTVNGGPHAGVSSVIVNVEKPPSGGSCSAVMSTRKKRQASLTPGGLLQCNCAGFGTDVTFTIMANNVGSDTKMVLKASKDPVFDFSVPFGAEHSQYLLDISVKVSNQEGAFVVLYLMLHEHAPPSDTNSVIEQILFEGVTEISRITAEANLPETINMFMEISTQLNADKCDGIDISVADAGYGPSSQTYVKPEADPNLTPEEVEAQLERCRTKRDKKSQFRNEMISTAVNNLTPQDTAQLTILATAINEFTSVPSEITSESQDSIAGFLGNTIEDLESRELSTDELIVLSDHFFTTVGNILASTSLAVVEGIKSDIKSVEEDEEWYDYNTYMNSPDQGFDDLSQSWDFKKDRQSQKQKQKNTVTQPKLMGMTDDLTNVIAKKMVSGESPVRFVTPQLSITISKDTPDRVTGISGNEQGSEFTIPPFAQWGLGLNENPATMITQIMTTPSNPFSTANSVPGESAPSPDSGTFTFNAYREDGTPYSVVNADTPFLFSLPRSIDEKDIPEPDYIVPLILANSTQHLFYSKFTHTTRGDTIISEIIPDGDSQQLLVVVYVGEDPTLKGPFYRIDGYGVAGNSHNRKGGDSSFQGDTSAIFIPSDVVDELTEKRKTQEVYFGIRQLPETDFTSLPKDPKPGTGMFTTNYTQKIFSSSCKYFDKTSGKWSTKGLKVQQGSTEMKTKCASNHLTTFGSSWAVAPNTIDFDFVFSNMDFFKNPTLYVAEIIVLAIFLIFAVWARRKDIQDKIRLGVTPLPDNDALDRYYYEIIMQTGIRKNAMCDSKVHFILSGEYDETDVRVFEDPERKIFRRGATDSFLMTTERPLGPLSYARVWHDNSGKGKYQSWFLNYMIVHDLQTKERFFFIANKWFAVEEGDGQIDHLLPISGPEQMMELGHLLSNSASKKLGDDHIWFSVIARPPESRFTRLQRLCCCLLLLFSSMLANAMYYETVADGAGQNGLTFGPFSLTPEQIYVGVISNLVVFPVNFLVVTLFRKSRPRKKRSSRLLDAIRKNEASAQAKEQRSGDLSIFSSSTDLDPLNSSSSRPVTPETSAMTRPLAPMVPDPQANQQNSDEKTEAAKKKKKAFSLPWWCMIIAWIVLWLSFITSAVFVTFYGISFGDEKTRKWITSLVISFLTSIFITQPIKVFLVALLFSLIFKKSDLIDEVAEEDEEDIQLGNDEQYLHKMPGDHDYQRRERKLAYSPPDPALLEKARVNRLKELQMYDILREILFYSMFLWILLVVSYGFRDPNAFYMKENLQSTITDLGLGEFAMPHNDFKKMASMDDFWSWAENTLVPATRASDWYNGQEPLGQRGFMHDRTSRLMGYAVMRQLRIHKNECNVVPRMRTVVPHCFTPYSVWSEDKDSYGVGWMPFEGNSSANNSMPEFVYRDAADLEGWPYYGKHAVYGGGGYVAELKGSERDVMKLIMRLKESEWIDRETRAVFIEFTAYNAYVNLFGITTFIAEFLNTGGIQPYYRVEPMNLLGYTSGAQLFQVICQAIYLFFILFFIIKEIRKMYKQKRAYWKEPWNYIELAIILLSIGGMVIYFYRLIKSKELTERFKETKGNAYMKFQYVAYWNELLLYMLGWLCFLATVKFIRLLRFNKRMNLLAQTLRHGAKPLLMFSIMFFIVFFAFAQFFYFVYFMELNNFSHIIYAAETCMQMLIGKFNFSDMQGASPVLGPLFFFCYVVTVYYVLINMFLTILNESFSAVRSNIELQTNEYEMVEFIVDRFSQWTGIGSKKPAEKPKSDDAVNGQTQTLEDAVNNFPERVDRLMDTISKVFLDQSTFESMFINSNKARSKDAMKSLMKNPSGAHSYEGLYDGGYSGKRY